MTIQNWSLWPDRATIVCDTLVSDARTDQPTGFASKVWIVPHALTMIASKSWAAPGALMRKALEEGILPTDIHALAPHGPEVFQAALQAAPEMTERAWTGCKMVIFGWDQARHEPCGYLFEVEDGFTPKRFLYGEILMPDVPEARVVSDHWTRGLIQQAYDRSLPIDDRDNIGGQLVQAELYADEHGPMIHIRSLGDMPHFRDDSKIVESVAIYPPYPSNKTMSTIVDSCQLPSKIRD